MRSGGRIRCSRVRTAGRLRKSPFFPDTGVSRCEAEMSENDIRFIPDFEDADSSRKVLRHCLEIIEPAVHRVPAVIERCFSDVSADHSVRDADAEPVAAGEFRLPFRDGCVERVAETCAEPGDQIAGEKIVHNIVEPCKVVFAASLFAADPSGLEADVSASCFCDRIIELSRIEGLAVEGFHAEPGDCPRDFTTVDRAEFFGEGVAVEFCEWIKGGGIDLASLFRNVLIHQHDSESFLLDMVAG